MLTVNDIQTVAVEVINEDGSKIEPVYEAYGEAKFQEFVAWYSKNLNVGQTAFVRGIGYENGERQVLNTVFVIG
jgi:hypothetical protein